MLRPLLILLGFSCFALTSLGQSEKADGLAPVNLLLGDWVGAPTVYNSQPYRSRVSWNTLFQGKLIEGVTMESRGDSPFYLAWKGLISTNRKTGLIDVQSFSFDGWSVSGHFSRVDSLTLYIDYEAVSPKGKTMKGRDILSFAPSLETFEWRFYSIGKDDKMTLYFEENMTKSKK